MSVIEVAVGVVMRNKQIYITKRADHLHQGGKWEFPGGKREPGETIQQALSRELGEEIGIEVISQRSLMVIRHDYIDKQVCLDVRIIDAFNGEPHGKEGQIGQWVALEQLDNYTFPDANRAIVEALMLA